jgi:hypothetical protein
LKAINMPGACLEEVLLDALPIEELPPGDVFFPNQELRLKDPGFHLEEGYYCLTGGLEVADIVEKH